MHTVIAAHCTGCELCIPVCPVDCIELHNASGPATGWSAWSPQQAEHARQRYVLRREREQERLSASRAPTPRAQAEQAADDDASPHAPCPAPPVAESKQATIAAILARARAQRAGGGSSPNACQ